MFFCVCFIVIEENVAKKDRKPLRKSIHYENPLSFVQVVQEIYEKPLAKSEKYGKIA